MSKYLIKDKRAFVSFPGLSSSVLLIGLKVNPLFVWSVMGEGGELFSLIIVPSTSERNSGHGVSHVHLP